MSDHARDAFLVAIVTLLIIVGALIISDLTAQHIGALTALLFGLILIGSIQTIAWYKLRRAQIDSDTQIAMVKYNPMANRQPKVIPFNSPSKKVRADGVVQLTESLAVDKQDLIDFVAESVRDDGIGLAISRWKSEGWEQSMLEALLDYMNTIGLVTPRVNGRACNYVEDFTADEVLRVIGSNVYG